MYIHTCIEVKIFVSSVLVRFAQITGGVILEDKGK
jgi:hypothetical protein